MLPRRDVSPRELLVHLAPERADATLRELGEGFDNVAYLVDDELVLRISKYNDVDERQRVAVQDREILTLANRYSILPTSRLVESDIAQGALLLTHVEGAAMSQLVRADEPGAGNRAQSHTWPLAPQHNGRDAYGPSEVGFAGSPVRRYEAARHGDSPALVSLDRSAFTAQFAEFVTELWAAPADELHGHVPMPPVSATQWLARTTTAYEQITHPLAAGDRRRIESFLSSPVLGDDTWGVFSHNDLGADHLFVDADGKASGVIDWSDAVIGDPARDLALLMLDVGPTLATDVVDQLGAHQFGDLTGRARWWAARSGVEGVVWRAENRPDTVERALIRLRAVLAF